MLHQVPLPPVTQHHLLYAYAIIRPIGVSFEAAMQLPECAALRRVIEYKAAMLRTEAWNAIFTTTTMIDKDHIQAQARSAARHYSTMLEACPYPFGSEAGRVFKEEFIAAREGMAMGSDDAPKAPTPEEQA